MSVTDMIIWNWSYDQQGAIRTSAFDFAEDLPRFLILLFAWQRFTEQDWGIVPGRTFTCDNEVEVTLAEDQNPIHILGGGTTVLRATSTRGQLKEVSLVVKFSCPEESRIPDTEILDTMQQDADQYPDFTDHTLHYTATKSTTHSTVRIRKRLKLNTEGARKSTVIICKVCLPLRSLIRDSRAQLNLFIY